MTIMLIMILMIIIVIVIIMIIMIIVIIMLMMMMTMLMIMICDTATDADTNSQTRHARRRGEAGTTAPLTTSASTPSVRPVQVGEWIRKVSPDTSLTQTKMQSQSSYSNHDSGALGSQAVLKLLHWRASSSKTSGHINCWRSPWRLSKLTNNCFGQLEYRGIDETIIQDRPTMAPFTLWKHAPTSQAIQGTAGRTSQDHGLSRETSQAPSRPLQHLQNKPGTHVP